MIESPYLTCKEVQSLLGISRTSAYKIIRMLNEELEKKNYIIIRGKVAKEYLYKRLGIKEQK
jgi:hypothetical protein